MLRPQSLVGEHDAGIPSSSTFSETPTLFLKDSTLVDSKILWSLPFVAFVLAFWSFPWVSATFHTIVQWATANTWIPEGEDQLSLQTNVVTQVVNGPVITSISVLFATLVSMTFSTLYSRQESIQKSFLLEVAAQRQLETLLAHPVCKSTLFDNADHEAALNLVQSHSKRIMSEANMARGKNNSRDERTRLLNDTPIHSLLDWCNHVGSRQRRVDYAVESILSQTMRLVEKIVNERTQRFLSVSLSAFPAVHYLTLGFLAIAIAISFLVATDEAEFIFLRGLPVRILWTLLVTSFTALSVVCYDLSNAYTGAYHI